MSCAEVRRRLDRYGLLLLQDKKLPSVATIFAGEPMSRSWWSHPRSHEMFRCLRSIEHEVLTTRLINGKVTYVHKRLWPALAATGTPVTDEVHTESGRHERRVETSESWAKRLKVKPLASAAAGRMEIEAAAAALGAPPRSLPWHSR
ncbi:MAG TPA: hypothetical protein VGS96_22965 [Thermoanaerobaculia bacterium]|jgi:hypothetical protein|nr:hypothetical protein [Thermoanaerobaculia bacterium]